jgi:hypothetical protein
MKKIMRTSMLLSIICVSLIIGCVTVIIATGSLTQVGTVFAILFIFGLIFYILK